MRKKTLLFMAVVCALLSPQPAFALDPRELMNRSKMWFEDNRGRRGGGYSGEELTTRQAMKESEVQSKNEMLDLASQPLVVDRNTGELTPENQTVLAASFQADSLGAVSAPQQAGWSGGSTYPTIYFDPQIRGRAYALSDSSGFYRSDDGGVNWYASNSGIQHYTITSLAIAPSNHNILYASSTAGMHRSTDGGKTWTYYANTANIPFKRLASGRAIAVSATDPYLAYAGSSNGQVYVKTGGSSNWTQLGSLNLGVPVSAVHLARDGRLFVGSQKGLHLWRPATNSWQLVPLEAGGGAWDIVSLIENGVETLFVTDGLRIARTSQTGVPTAWTYTSAMPRYDSGSQGEASRLAVRRLSNGQLQYFVGQKRDWQGKVYLSSDGGATWRNVSSGFVNDPAVNPTRVWKKNNGVPVWVSFDPFNASTLYFSDDWTIWKSTDNGTTWRESITGTPNTIGTSLAYDPRTNSYLVGTMDNGLVEVNVATGAKKAVFPTSATPASLWGHVWRVEVLANGNRVLTVSPWNGTQNYVVVITPSGTQTLAKGLPTWFPRQNTVWEKGYARGFTKDPSNPNRLYLAIDGDDGGGLFVTNDGGFNWTRLGNPSSRKIYNGLAVDPSQPTTLYWGTMWAQSAGGIFKSTNSGQTWTRVFSTNPNIADIAVDRNGVVWAAGETTGGQPAVYVSRNRGTTWTLVRNFNTGAGPAQALLIDPQNPNRIFVSQKKWSDVAGSKIWMTADGGTTWKEVLTTGLPNSSGAVEISFAPDRQSLYVLLNNGTLYQTPVPS